MGYGTWFTGSFKLDRSLSPHHLSYLQAFSEAQHVHWNVDLVKHDPDPLREAVGLHLGENGCYFTGRGFKKHYCYPPWQSTGTKETGRAPTDPAYLGAVCPGTPNHLCAWAPSDDGTELVIRSDKPYGYIKWLQYLLDHFLVPWGYILNGEMTWQGEGENDTGVLLVKGNVITVRKIPLLNEELL